jgi:hypothetical protein
VIDEKLQSVNDLIASASVPLNEKQQMFLHKFISSNRHGILQGIAGVGKGEMIKLLKKWYGEELAVFCSTGVASQNLSCSYGTAHAYLSLPIKPATEYDYKKVSSKSSGLLGGSDKIKIILIDEAFLLNSDNLDVIWRRLERFNRKYRKRKKRNIRLVLVGDTGQSVTIADDDLKAELKSRWGSHLMFESSVWGRFNFEYYVLDKVERQEDKVFKACLDVIRYNQKERFDKCFKWLNKRQSNQYNPEWIYLAATNKQVDSINESVLNNNPNEKFHFPALIQGDFNIKDTLVRENGVTICKGLKVMTITNEEYGRWSNGSTGIVTLADSEGCYIKFDHSGKEEYVTLNEWQNKEVYTEDVVDKESGEITTKVKEKILGSMVCLPVLPSSSISIMKSQGITISTDYIIDLGEDYLYTWKKMGDFATNFLYLGLSRGVDINKIHLKQQVKPFHVKVSEESIKFWKYCKEKSLI